MDKNHTRSRFDREEKVCLGIFCLQYHRGRQVEDATGALDRRLNGSRVEEVHLEQPEPRFRAVQGQQVLRLPLVLCKNDWSRYLLDGHT
jgi:hypothetical protein